MSEQEFLANLTAYDAVERCLERISEAAKKLGQGADSLVPELAWPRIRALGNVLRHEYDVVDPLRGWFIVKDDLPVMKPALERALEVLRGSERR